jgi:hypothetical protein
MVEQRLALRAVSLVRGTGSPHRRRLQKLDTIRRGSGALLTRIGSEQIRA